MADAAGTCYDVVMKVGARQTNIKKSVAPRKRGRGVPLGLLGFLLALGVFLLWAYHGVSPVVRAEYGEGVPDAAAFCREEDAFLLTDESSARLGRHAVQVITRFRVVPCLLIVRDTQAPVAAPVRAAFAPGYVPAPDEFITDLRDADRVGVSFAEAYDFSEPGEQSVRILLEDGSGNVSEVDAVATVHAGVDRVVVEAGGPAPGEDAFCGEKFHGTLLDPITDRMLHEPGEYSLRTECRENGNVFCSTLVVQDTVPPVATGKRLTLLPGESATPEAFLTDVVDETEVSFAFVQAPDPESRQIQDVLIRMTDAGGNQTDVPAQALYSSLAPVTAEVHNGLLTGADLGRPDAEPEPFEANVPGTYPLRFQVGGQAEIGLVTLVDTVSPVLSLREGPFYTHHDWAPEQLVRAEDVTEVRLSFVRAPDFASDQAQTFTVRAVDAAGNETVASFPLTLAVDDTPPTLYGVENRTCYVNEPIAYLMTAYAEDAVDGRVDVTVESEVIPSQAGRYTVTYTAADRSGNRASRSCTYTLVEPAVSERQVREAAQKVLGKITSDDMVLAEKLRAVYDYLHENMRFSGSSDKTDWRKEALRGLTTYRGDCFTYFSATRALLDELDVPYLCVTRKSDTSRHYWVIVNIGTGWYHFDPINYYSWNLCFMWTNEQCRVGSKRDFWRFHEENFPPIATEPFDYDAVVQIEREGRLP